MSSNQSFVDFVIGQLQAAGNITFKKMFGEYALYSGNKIFALICDNKLFIKPTIAGKNYIQDVVEAPPYTGAKPCFLIEDKIEDHEWLCTLALAKVQGQMTSLRYQLRYGFGVQRKLQLEKQDLIQP